LSELGGALVQLSSGSSTLLTGARAPELVGLVAGGALLVISWYVSGPPRLGPLRAILLVSALVFLVPFLLSVATGMWLFVPHFMVFLLPASMVAIGAGVTRLPAHYGSMSRVPLVLVGGLLALWTGAQLWGLVLYYNHPPHGTDGLREMAAVLRTQARAGDAVLVTPPALMPSLRQYYAGETYGLPSDFDLRAVYLPYDAVRWNADCLRVLEQRAGGRTRIWLVYRPELDRDGGLLAAARARYHESIHTSYPFADLYLYTR
jgi:hypothetical protein